MKRLVAGLCLSAFASIGFAANPIVEMRTNQGSIELELYQDKAPKSVANFLEYVRGGHYDGTIFHRVISGFMIQGGGFDGNMRQKPTRAAIENEAKNGLRNEPGTIAMARTSNPHSATAQFFINLVPNTFLDHPGQDGWGYAVFGKVTKGMDVVEKIGRVPTGISGGMRDVPQQAVTIESVRIVETAKDGASRQ